MLRGFCVAILALVTFGTQSTFAQAIGQGSNAQLELLSCSGSEKMTTDPNQMNKRPRRVLLSLGTSTGGKVNPSVIRMKTYRKNKGGAIVDEVNVPAIHVQLVRKNQSGIDIIGIPRVIFKGSGSADFHLKLKNSGAEAAQGLATLSLRPWQAPEKSTTYDVSCHVIVQPKR